MKPLNRLSFRPVFARAAFFLSMALAPILAHGQTTTTGAALWSEFVANPDNHSHIPNVAYAGYRRGEAEIPDLPVVANVLDFGAVNDGTGDNSRAFRLAIDAAWYAGGGAVLVPAGTYRINQIILLHRDGVVLRGEGKGETILEFDRPLVQALGSTGHGNQHWNWTGGLVWVGPSDLFTLRSEGFWRHTRIEAPEFNVNAGNWEAWRRGETLAEVTSTHERGTRSVTLDDASGLTPGDFVLMTWENPPDDALWREIMQHAAFEDYDFGDWLEATPFWAWPVEIQSVDGNTISFVRPTRVSIQPEYNVRIREIGPHVREAGVESMTLLMNNERETYSYNNGDGWNGVFFNRAINSWARDVEVINAETPLNVSASLNVTVLNYRSLGDMQAKYISTNRVMSHEVLYDGLEVLNTGVLSNGINTEWLSTGNVWTRGNFQRGTFDSHRLMSFDYLRTEITMRNPDGSRPGGAARAGPFTGRRAVHWNINIVDSDRPEAERGMWVYDPLQYTYGAQIGITGAAPYERTSMWAMRPGDKNMLIGDDGIEPAPANLFDAQVALRRENEAWAVLAYPNDGFLPIAAPTFRASVNSTAGTAVAAVHFYLNGDLVGTVTDAPFSFEWADAVPGRYQVEVEMVNTDGVSTWSRPYDVVVGERIRLEHNDPSIVYSGGSWQVLSHPEFSAGQARFNDTVGDAYFEVVFRGTRARWVTRRTNQGQSVVVSLNGFDVHQGSVHSGTSAMNFVGWDSGELEEGIYTLRIRTTTRLLLDHLEITSTDGAVGEPTAPDAPGNLNATPVSPSEIDLLWTRGSSNEQGFYVERRESGETDWARIATVGAAFTNFGDSQLEHGVTYEYRVQAFNAFGESPFSEIVTATTPEPATAPNPPSDLSVTGVTHNRVDLAWVNNASDHEGFEIERMAEFGAWEPVALLPLTATTWIDIGLIPETTYQYRVRAFNSAGASAFSNVVLVTTEEFSETAGNLFPESWFLQAIDETGSITVNQPDHVAFEGDTNSHRGAVARLNESTTLAAEGDFISFDFTTENLSFANNAAYVLRFGFYDDLGTPVTDDHSRVTDDSVGFFAASGNRITNGRRTDIYAQGPGTAQILARDGGTATNLSHGGITRHATTDLANFGNRTATFMIQRLADGALRVSLDMVDSASRFIYLVREIPASDVPTYTFNQLAVSFVGSGMDFTDIILQRGGPSFDEATPLPPFQAWQADHFTEAELADPAISGPLADPAGTGLTNLQRYAFGLDRDEPTAAADTVLESVHDGEEHSLLFTHLRSAAANDLTFRIEASPDLIDWDTLTPLVEPYGEPEATDRPGVYRHTHRLATPHHLDRAFLRLSIEMDD
jgi:hypothetical protein